MPGVVHASDRHERTQQPRVNVDSIGTARVEMQGEKANGDV